MKDIIIDAQAAKKLSKPPNNHYSDLIDWLLFFDPKKMHDNAWIVYSNKLYKEYSGGHFHCAQSSSIIKIIDVLIQQSRYTKISNEEIKAFQKKFFTKIVWKTLRCKLKKSSDPDHIPVVLLSNRKMILSEDGDFIYDLINFPRFGRNVNWGNTPDQLNYK